MMDQKSYSPFLLLFVFFVFGSKQIQASDALISLENEMGQCLNSMRSSNEDKLRLAYSDTLLQLVREVVNTEGSFEHPFESLKGMGVLMSPDNKLKLFNWNVPMEDQTHQYHCILLHRPEKKSILTDVYELHQTRPFFDKTTRKYLSAEDWYGALYYEIIPSESRGGTSYTLLGWIGKDQLSTMKVIDVLEFTRRGLRLGSPEFKTESGTDKRFFLEYSNEVNVSLKFHEKEEKIVFDHLSPRASGLEGNAAFYGPDFTYDAFIREKGKWVYYRDIYITSGKPKDDRPFINPGR
jgi:hypothetical protein